MCAFMNFITIVLPEDCSLDLVLQTRKLDSAYLIDSLCESLEEEKMYFFPIQTVLRTSKICMNFFITIGFIKYFKCGMIISSKFFR